MTYLKGEMFMKKCAKCGQFFADGAFCPQCGIVLIEAAEGEAPAAAETGAADGSAASFPGEYHFYHSKFFGTEIITDIKTDGRTVDITQNRKIMFCKKSQNVRFDVGEINDVITKSSYSAKSVLLIIGGFMVIKYDNWIIGLLMIIIGFLLLKNTFVYIYLKNGHIKIPLDAGSEKEIEEFINYIRFYNPDSIRIDINN